MMSTQICSDSVFTKDTEIGPYYVSQKFKPSLDKFAIYAKSACDREKIFKLIKSLETSYDQCSSNKEKVQEYKLKKYVNRPFTADPKSLSLARLNRFSTTYNDNFPIREMKETAATRPPSTNNLIARPNDMVEDAEDQKVLENIAYDISPTAAIESHSSYEKKTSYQVDFCSQQHQNKPAVHPSPDRCGTASGSRCNNPHPNKEFLVWRFPRRSARKASRLPSATPLRANMTDSFAQITDDDFNRVMRGNCRSTYQSDFRGGESSVETTVPFYLQPEIKTGEKLKISTQRIDYDRPKSLPVQLSVPQDRYGSNKIKNQSVHGIIPEAINKIYMNINTKTTYDDDINGRAKLIHGAIVNDIQRKIEFSKLHNLRDLERAIINSQDTSDKESLEMVLQRLNEPPDYKRKSYVRKPYYNNNGNLNWASSWAGPL